MSCQIGSSYIIKTGDTLFNIAQQQLNNGDRWHEILKPDGTSFTEEDVRNLQIGQEVCIPQSGNGSTGGNTSDGFASIVSRQTYETIFPERNDFYTCQ
uniref:LysM domain-containing protein n=1 Tax=Tolypothrix bouteillei VB521301 TaxID=1479485 RepID=A0A0C1MVX3_9CYAN